MLCIFKSYLLLQLASHYNSSLIFFTSVNCQMPLHMLLVYVNGYKIWKQKEHIIA